jgi:hypothetical protein
MANIFTLENVQDFSERLNLDELYEKKKQYDLSKLNLFNKILNRIHVRIKTTSRQKIDEHFCWFVVPEVIIGVPKYDQAACIAYLIEKLKGNDFMVRYIHPNTLFISWHHFVPTYVRTELKNKTGIVIDEHGNRVEQEGEEREEKAIQLMTSSSASSSSNSALPKKSALKKYTPIQSYKPSGHLEGESEDTYKPHFIESMLSTFGKSTF